MSEKIPKQLIMSQMKIFISKILILEYKYFFIEKLVQIFIYILFSKNCRTKTNSAF